MKRFPLTILLLILALNPVLAQPPNEYLRKKAAADDALREGVRLSIVDTFEADTKSYDLFKKALALYKEINDKDGQGQALYRSSQAANALGDKKTAVYLAQQALPFLNDPRNRIWEARLWNHLGLLYSSLGMREVAIRTYNLSLNIYRELDDFVESIPVINNIGRYYESIGDYDKALEHYNITLKYIEGTRSDSTLGDEEHLSMTLAFIAGVYQKQGKLKESLAAFEQALELQRLTGLRKGEQLTLNNMGIVYYQMGDNPRALEYFARSLALCELIGERNNVATTFSNLMQVHRRMGNIKEAIFFGKQAINKHQELRQNILDLDRHTRKAFVGTVENDYRILADMLIEAGLFAQAEQVLRMLKEEEFFEFVGRDADEIKTLGQRVALTPEEKRVIERYAALSGGITAIGKELAGLGSKQRELARTDAKLSASEQSRFDKLTADLADANAAFRLFLEKDLSKEFSEDTRKGIEFDRSLQANVALWEKGTVMLHTVVTPDRYRVILTTPDAQIDGKTEISAAELNKKIFAFRTALQDRAADPRPLAKELYDILIRPIEDDLKGHAAKTLVWSLDGILRYIPFAALSPDGKTYMAEHYRNVIITPRTRDAITTQDPDWQVLGVGVSAASTVPDPTDPKMVIDFRALPGARTELMKIISEGRGETGMFSGRRLLDREFTARSLGDSLSGDTGRKFNAVHMASHFRLGDDRATSFLLMGNGTTLSLEEISRSPRIAFSGVELVTLSACNTAFSTNSTGREIDSLADIIQAKNGKAVLATLWAVADESTSLLMSEFYRLRKASPAGGKADAIQNVQRAMIEGRIKVPPARAHIFRPKERLQVNEKLPKFVYDPTKPFAHPYYWSPFVLIGNWR